MLLECDPSGTAVITLDFPPANAIGAAQIPMLESAVISAAQSGCRVLLVRATGRFFCAGADIGIMQARDSDTQRAERLASFAQNLQVFYEKLEAFPSPTIAAIDGIATGGGLELALACDFRIARQGTQLGLPETKLGLIPAAGGTQRMVAVVGRAYAADMILRGRLVDGAEALRMGLVHESVQGEADKRPAEARARALAEELCALPQAALREAKRCMAMAGKAAGFAEEIEATRVLHAEPETIERIAAFLARSPRSRS